MSPPCITAPLLGEIPGLSHGFFGRRGGASAGIFSSLNAGEGSGDDPGAIAENRERIRLAMGAHTLLSCYQIHSPDVIEVTQPWTERPSGDAMVTRLPGTGLCILTADCAPVLFADPQAGVIGAAHAGWKGALAGVLDGTLLAMERLGASRDRIRGVIGPAISQSSYEVGPEFRDLFLRASPSHDMFFTSGAGDRFHFDLTGFCLQQLRSAGIGAATRIDHDTCALEDMYFSNRRRNRTGDPDYGRNASVISLT